ncbi:HEXXH motif-containing putative peptide modification protein [Halobacteriovorax sp. GB3]|uniref:aKG-HExxH-type peptide beta-hydroxylase n=1 Tax=Halobacteriovorax sp. GB3 TaxID=2719615 RepID=UPI00235E97A7|nr:HEXXH motif-containing putative peptide modification protein [Halobacteriovorax sp. GB3]MDD0854805.1 HEXXH motif-containing putative peptide modification protein [Halobacteriovorax sp. GB3]
MITSKNICSKEFHGTIKQNVMMSYAELIQDIREDMLAGYTTEHLSAEFLQALKELVKDNKLESYTPLKFYWSTLLENLIYVVQLHEEILETERNEEFEFSEAEDELFNFWNDSEMAQSFLEMLDENNNIIEASAHLLTLLENQILSFYYLHISNQEPNLKDVILYNAIPEIGDNEERLYIGESHKMADFEEPSDIFPNIALKRIFSNKSGIEVEINTDLFEVPLLSNDSFIKLKGKKVYLLPSCNKGKENLEQFKADTLKALNIIEASSEGLLDTFLSFTHSLVPVNETGIVSYSMQSLPGFSSINMFDRDFVDLMDDLLHENGHHYLNTFLNYSELLNEDDDKIYYSPWRRALRPVRGIYHACFTFFWALKLFHDLDLAIEEGKLEGIHQFSDDELLKIKKRAVEEYLMLTYCVEDLSHAYDNEKVTDEGNELIQSIYQLVNEMKERVGQTFSYLNQHHVDASKELNELAEHLREQRKHYELKS